jgi:hypothetical protein
MTPRIVAIFTQSPVWAIVQGPAVGLDGLILSPMGLVPAISIGTGVAARTGMAAARAAMTGTGLARNAVP